MILDLINQMTIMTMIMKNGVDSKKMKEGEEVTDEDDEDKEKPLKGFYIILKYINKIHHYQILLIMVP